MEMHPKVSRAKSIHLDSMRQRSCSRPFVRRRLAVCFDLIRGAKELAAFGISFDAVDCSIELTGLRICSEKLLVQQICDADCSYCTSCHKDKVEGLLGTSRSLFACSELGPVVSAVVASHSYGAPRRPAGIRWALRGIAPPVATEAGASLLCVSALRAQYRLSYTSMSGHTD